MANLKFDVNDIVSTILEYQKNIILNKECIKVLEEDGLDACNLRDEISDLELKIKELQRNIVTV